MQRTIITSLIISVVLGIGCSENTDSPEEYATVPINDIRDTLIIVDSSGIELGDINYVFGSIREIDRGPRGEILVLDNIRCCILVYSQQGEFITQIGRYGHGPGEMGSAGFFEVLGDGSICVDDENGWLRFDSEWEFIDSRIVSSANLMQTTSTGERQIVGIESIFGNVDGNLAVTKNISLWSDSTPGDAELIFYTQVYPVEEPQDIYVVDFNPMLFSVGEDHIYIAPNPQNEPLLFTFAIDGSPLDTLILDYPEVLKSQQEIEDEIMFFEAVVSTTTSGEKYVDWEPSPYRDMIKYIGIDSLGMIWVQRGFELTPTFDIFEPSNLEQVGIACIPDRDDARDWHFDISENGIVAYPLDPEYYQKIYLIE
jgi:hypothetical protein